MSEEKQKRLSHEQFADCLDHVRDNLGTFRPLVNKPTDASRLLAEVVGTPVAICSVKSVMEKAGLIDKSPGKVGSIDLAELRGLIDDLEDGRIVLVRRVRQLEAEVQKINAAARTNGRQLALSEGVRP